MMKCNEILLDQRQGQEYVCEAEWGTEHTHANLMPYMRPMREGEEFRIENDCRFLVTNLTRFCDVWKVKLAAAIEKTPEEYLLKDAGAIVARMRKSLPTGGFNLSPTLKAAAKEIGIKPTMTAIMAYCRE